MTWQSAPSTGAPPTESWKAPAGDGEVLIWPQPGQIIADAWETARRLSSANSVLVQNAPLAEIRRRMRQWVGHDDEKLLFVAGHQTELHHPGVWAKNVLIDAAARHARGEAYHVAVDTDQPKHLRLRWPGGGEVLTDHPKALSASWAALLDPPTPAHLAAIEDQFEAAASGWTFNPLVGDFLRSLRRLSLESPNLAAALTNAMHELDWSLGLRHHALTISPLLGCEAYLAFVHHVMAQADRFASDYNAALDAYRREHRIRNSGRPMPNLRVTHEATEVPFWLDNLSTGARTRAQVVRRGNGFAFGIGAEDEFRLNGSADAWTAAGDLQQFLRTHSLRLAPRALTLTMVLRLFLADQFVHGIGGARYDQVTDRLIERHFSIQAPPFCVTTATLYFPGAIGRPRACVSCVKAEGHRLRHNVLGEEKMRLVHAIAAAPRKSPERSRLFFQMHEKLTAAQSHPLLREWQQRLQEAEQQSREDQAVFDRELFYAIQPRDRLMGLIERFRSLFMA